jgi:hypothetical protein
MRGTVRRILWLVACAAGAAVRADDAPPLELIDTNVRDTAYTAHVHIDAVAAADANLPGYVTFRVRATVKETFKGAARPQVEYFETREAPSTGPRAGADVLVSLNARRDGTFAGDRARTQRAGAAPSPQAGATGAALFLGGELGLHLLRQLGAHQLVGMADELVDLRALEALGLGDRDPERTRHVVRRHHAGLVGQLEEALRIDLEGKAPLVRPAQA